jgi:hypothetical protein
MIERFASGALFVVARDASAAGLRMIELFDLPIAAAVTGCAIRTGRYVILGFTGGNVAVVAGEAPSSERRVIDLHLCPINLPVALTASLRGFRMIGRFAFGHAAAVASLTGLWESFEHRARVAGLARHGAMRALEGKSRLPMIEVAVDLDGAVDVLSRCKRADGE